MCGALSRTLLSWRPVRDQRDSMGQDLNALVLQSAAPQNFITNSASYSPLLQIYDSQREGSREEGVEVTLPLVESVNLRVCKNDHKDGGQFFMHVMCWGGGGRLSIGLLHISLAQM